MCNLHTVIKGQQDSRRFGGLVDQQAQCLSRARFRGYAGRSSVILRADIGTSDGSSPSLQARTQLVVRIVDGFVCCGFRTVFRLALVPCPKCGEAASVACSLVLSVSVFKGRPAVASFSLTFCARAEVLRTEAPQRDRAINIR